MGNIQPVSTWFQGATRQANVFSLFVSYDDVKTSASIKYQLIELIVVSQDEQSSQTLVSGELLINGFDYEMWNASTNANAFIYDWAAQKLNLVLIP